MSPALLRRIAAAVISISLACAAVPAASQAGSKKFGTIHKDPVDLAVAMLRQGAVDGGFGDGSCRQTAMVLAALGHCHRYYSLQEPFVRAAVRKLFAARDKDGAFGDPGTSHVERIATTMWVVDALGAVDLEADYAADLAACQRWLHKQSTVVQAGFAATVSGVLARHAAGDGDPLAQGKAAAEIVTTAFAGPRPASETLVEPLVTLVACQAAARRLDQEPQAAAAAAPWSTEQQKALEFLMTQQDGGSFFVATKQGRFPDLGLTALALAALQTKPAALRSAKEKEVIEYGLKTLVAAQKEADGSIGDRNTNYTTCAAILALTMAKRDALAGVVEKARNYVLAIQNVESIGYARGDRDYGSIGYGGSQRGDMSNTQFAVEALRASGLQADHEALQKALVFMQRTQNLRSVNDFKGRVKDDDGKPMDVVSGDDGGAAYYPGNSAVGYTALPDGTKIPRSYGSMTYALLKGYTLAGIPANDPRVVAALKWIERNWTLSENPGADPEGDPKQRHQGLFYYYMVLAQALDLAGIRTLRVPGKAETDEALEVDWRKELRTTLAAMQRADGSWVNEQNSRWWEDQPALCTIYALLALARAQ